MQNNYTRWGILRAPLLQGGRAGSVVGAEGGHGVTGPSSAGPAAMFGEARSPRSCCSAGGRAAGDHPAEDVTHRQRNCCFTPTLGIKLHMKHTASLKLTPNKPNKQQIYSTFSNLVSGR